MCFALATTIVALAILGTASPQPAKERTGMAIPLTKPSSWMNHDTSVNYDAFHSHISSVNTKFMHGSENYERNTGTRHPSVARRLGKRQNSVPLTKRGIWYGTVSVGTPPQPFTVWFDTGSCDFFLPTPNCVTCNRHSLWDPTSSSSAEDLRAPFQLSYAVGGLVTGHLYRDTVSVAGFNATHQTIAAATSYPSKFRDPQFPADGIMGMSFQWVSAYGATSVFQTLVSQEQVVHPVFSFKFSDPGAELYIGGSNPDLYNGSFTYVPVTVEAYWQVTIDSIQANDQTIFENLIAVIDTGSAVICGPLWDLTMLNDALDGTYHSLTNDGVEFYTFPCNSFPNVSLGFGGRMFEIPPSSLNIGPVSPGSSDCFSGIVGLETPSSFWIIGNVFLQNFYTTFEFNNLRVGFAQLAGV